MWKKELEVVLIKEKQLERDEAKWKTKLEGWSVEVVGGAGLLEFVHETGISCCWRRRRRKKTLRKRKRKPHNTKRFRRFRRDRCGNWKMGTKRCGTMRK